ncbi:MAG TPA: nuclear transport factor 2 family protein [Acidimicrobiales bacterium]
MTDDRMTAEAVHDTGVRRLQHAYADVVNRRAWPELEALFRPDAVVVIDRRAGEPLRLTGGSEVGAFIGTAIAHFSFFEFVILNAHIVFPAGPEAEAAVCRLFMCELRQEADTGRFSTAFGLYHDRYVLESGRWWFAERRYHSIARHGGVLDVFPLPDDPGINVPGAGG